eukprot:7394636-Karenia_brevis.AAC.1
MKTLPQLIFKDVIKPLLQSQQMEPADFLKYVKAVGNSPIFEQQLWIQGAWVTLCQGKLTEDPILGTEYVLLSCRSTMQYGAENEVAEWDVKSQ